MANLRFGLVGYGAWGSHHARAIRETPGCELRMVCASSEPSRARAAAETGAEVTADYRELVSHPAVDVVDIVVPNYMHESIAVAALESGKHVLLEKPMATTVSACDHMIDAAWKSGRVFMVGHEMRVSPLYCRMQEALASSELGEPRYVLIDLWRRPYRGGSGAWRLDPERVGNWTLEEPVHFFDAAGWFLASAGAPVTVYAHGASREAAEALRCDRADHFTAIVGYASGAYAAISQTLAAVEHHFSIKIFGSKAFLRAEWHAELDRSEHPAYSLEISRDGHMEAVEVPGTPGEFYELKMEIAAFASAVRQGASLPITPEEARRAVALCLMAQRSLETGEVVRFPS
ncbi:MAG TPA: Gfo/Idh/MocA family oxidoreductase [Terriglobia bacterium]|nr:Gfo/Idh/MocA family oxidoreductase [Terriglobia bacterium]